MRVELLEEYVRETYGLSPEWKLRRTVFYHLPHGKGTYVWLQGAVAPLLTRERDKGKPNWSKMDKTTLVDKVFKTAKYEAWVEERKKRCRLFLGSTERMHGMVTDNGENNERTRKSLD